MNREQKTAILTELTGQFNDVNYLYLADTSGISANDTNLLRREMFKNGVKMKVAKNSLITKAMENADKDFSELLPAVKQTTALLFSENAKAPALAIMNFRKKGSKPVLKGAYIDSAVFLGDDQLENLSKLRSKVELIGDIILQLQSPARNVISALQSSGGKLAGIVKTLQEKNN
jgi:large subunit ribosomal protein L10